MRTRRTTAGASGLRAPIRLILALAGILACLPVAADGKDRKPQEASALIAGTVFRDTGFLLRGAAIEVAADPEANSFRKFKKTRVISDGRGEFAVRVPAEPMRYTVSASAPGFRAETKTVSIGGEERVDVFFRHEPEDK